MLGDVDHLRSLGLDQAAFFLWSAVNADLVESVRDGRVACCGEWTVDGYHGWCSRLGKPHWSRVKGYDDIGPRYERCTGCPRAAIGEAIGNWYVDLLTEIEAISKGEIDVWTGFGEGDAGAFEIGS